LRAGSGYGERTDKSESANHFVTVTVEVPVFPSLVAVIVAVPSATPLTTPDELTVALDVSLEVHVTTRPVRRVPLASRSVAVRDRLEPLFTEAGEGVTVTVATGAGVIVTVVDPLFPPLVAVITTLPELLALTRPVDETVARLELLVLQLTARSVTTTPF